MAKKQTKGKAKEKSPAKPKVLRKSESKKTHKKGGTGDGGARK